MADATNKAPGAGLRVKQTTRGLALALAITITGGCGAPAEQSQAESELPPRTPLRDLAAAAPGDTVFYRGLDWPRERYERQIVEERAALTGALDAAYPDGGPFFTDGFHNFDLALEMAGARSNSAGQPGAADIQRMQRLLVYTRAFHEQVYPRFFRYEPRRPFRIVYFRDRARFRAATRSPAYGFYRPANHILFSYSGAGHGTLWHELVHAFAAENSEDSLWPQWFSEGFASFYEMAFLDDRGQVSEGYANWRLPKLQRDIRARRLAPLGTALLRPYFAFRLQSASETAV